PGSPEAEQVFRCLHGHSWHGRNVTVRRIHGERACCVRVNRASTPPQGRRPRRLQEDRHLDGTMAFAMNPVKSEHSSTAHVSSRTAATVVPLILFSRRRAVVLTLLLKPPAITPMPICPPVMLFSSASLLPS